MAFFQVMHIATSKCTPTHRAPGENAKEIFEKARLPNEVLGRIWNLSDTEQRGALNVTEFSIAMHLLASYRTGNMKALPNALPQGLYEAASRRGQPPPPPDVPSNQSRSRASSAARTPPEHRALCPDLLSAHRPSRHRPLVATG
jgi:hypothetical protein